MSYPIYLLPRFVVTLRQFRREHLRRGVSNLARFLMRSPEGNGVIRQSCWDPDLPLFGKMVPTSRDTWIEAGMKRERESSSPSPLALDATLYLCSLGRDVGRLLDVEQSGEE